MSLDDIPAGLSLPKSKGFVVEPLLLEGGGSGRVRFALVLTDPAYQAVFSVLCDDVARSAGTAIRPSSAFRNWVNRLHIWQEFMARHGIQGLSEAAATGLYGELLILRDLVIPSAGGAAAVQAWSGPLGEPNDFAFARGFLEVKTTIRQVPELIEISDVDQLDETRGTILLAHVKLRPSPVGETLPDLVSAVRGALACEAADHLQRFEQLLISVGYIDAHADLYDRTYSPVAIDFFRVAEGFPRLRRADLRHGIRFCSYTIEVSACSAHTTETETLRLLFSEAESHD
jgi:hypothetical protein